MVWHKAPALGIAAVLVATTVGATSAAAESSGPSRSAIARQYQTVFLPTLSVANDWNGSVSGCNPGGTGPAYEQATLTAVNYMRGLADLPAVSFDAALNSKSQSAALIMTAQGNLDHHPPQSWACWTEAGYDAASHSNLSLNVTGPAAIAGYMRDPGATNDVVGHRRWILYSAALTMGTGSTSASNALYVVGARLLFVTPTWVAWPTQGFFPWQLEPGGRWSLSLPGADFTKASIRASVGGTPLGVNQAGVRTGIGDNTISWQVALPAPANPQHPADLSVDVVADGVRLADGTMISYSYTVTLMDATAPIDGAEAPGGHTVPAHPTGVVATRNAGGIGVQWNPASDPTGQLLHYVVTGQPLGLGSRGLPRKTCRSTTSSCELAGTSKKVLYRVTVVALNALGPSEPMSVLSRVPRR